MDLAEIAHMLDQEAVEAGRSAGRVEVAATMIRISDEAYEHEVGYWRQRAVTMRAAAQTIRRQIRAAAQTPSPGTKQRMIGSSLPHGR